MVGLKPAIHMHELRYPDERHETLNCKGRALPVHWHASDCACWQAHSQIIPSRIQTDRCSRLLGLRGMWLQRGRR
ncbi:hypothetical protein BN2476_960064 [Paraburkholderia piptadeniae]|uniref:Uncharacterized protein n=1 Tax=Paraburkholderia piptadeniae TaxID=1701573 RepID=A0A1N7STV6_9BURK|nr:hypothetical protein BN2476_960064 [Paraburkholderia piptadeniae]